MRIFGACRFNARYLSQKRKLSNMNAALINLHTRTTEADIRSHPSFVGIKEVNFLPDSERRGRTAIISFEEPHHKKESLVRSRRLISGARNTTIPLTTSDRFRKPSQNSSSWTQDAFFQAKLLAHLNMDGILIDNLPADTTEEHIRDSGLEGIAEIYMINLGQLFRTFHPAIVQKKFAHVYFDSNKEAMSVVNKYVENPFSKQGKSSLKINGNEVQIRNLAFLPKDRGVGYSAKSNKPAMNEYKANPNRKTTKKRSEVNKKAQENIEKESSSHEDIAVDEENEEISSHTDYEKPENEVGKRIANKETFIF